MNSDTLVQLLQKGFRVTLGATASLIEILQDPQRRNENLAKLRVELSELAEEWAAKGEMTEQEARNFVDTLLSQQTQTTASQGTATTAQPAAPPDVQLDLQELTAQIAAIRAELERLREQDSSSS
jgi:polyhydroxyalkanoate synthesis regulator phasin